MVTGPEAPTHDLKNTGRKVRTATQSEMEKLSTSGSVDRDNVADMNAYE